MALAWAGSTACKVPDPLVPLNALSPEGGEVPAHSGPAWLWPAVQARVAAGG